MLRPHLVALCFFICCSSAASHRRVAESARSCGAPNDECPDTASGLMQKEVSTGRQSLSVAEEAVRSHSATSVAQQRQLSDAFGLLAVLEGAAMKNAVHSYLPEVDKHMQSLVQDVVDGGGEVNNITRIALEEIEREMLRIIEGTNKTHHEDQDEVNNLKAEIQHCSDAITQQLAVTAQRKTYMDVRKDNHNNCRLAQAQAMDDQTSTCNDWRTWARALRPPECAASFPKAISERYVCIQRMKNWSVQSNFTYNRKKAACNSDKGNRSTLQQTCDTNQVLFEMSFCNYADHLESACEDQVFCRNKSVTARNSSYVLLKAAEEARKAEYKSAEHVICLIKVLNGTAAEMPALFKGCADKVYDTTKLNIIYPGIPAAVACDDSRVEEKTCDGDWQQKYYTSQTRWYMQTAEDRLTNTTLIVSPLGCTPCPGTNQSSKAPKKVSELAAPTIIRRDASLWVRSSDLLPGPVVKWNNKGKSMIAHGLHTHNLAEVQRPTVPYAQSEDGQPFVRFDGVDDMLEDVTLQSSGNSLNIFMRVRIRGKDQMQALFDGSNGAMCLWVTTANTLQFNNCNTNGGVEDTIESTVPLASSQQLSQWMTIHAGVNNNQAALYVDGQLVSVNSGTNPTQFGDTLAASHSYSLFNRAESSTFDGDVAQIIVISDKISEQQRNEINTYLETILSTSDAAPPTSQPAMLMDDD